MNQVLVQWLLSGAVTTVMGGAILALFNRKRTGAETAEMANKAAAIGMQMVDDRMAHLRVELWDAMGLATERGRVMSKMDRAITSMRVRVERHGDWDHQVKLALDEFRRVLERHNIAAHITIEDPPSLDFSDIDFDFTIRPPSKAE